MVSTNKKKAKRKTSQKPSKKPSKKKASPDPRVATWINRLRENRPVRTRLKAGGRLSMDRSLPFLVTCRQAGQAGGPGVAGVLGAVSALAVAGPEPKASFAATLLALAEAGLADYGAFLLVEVWEDEDLDAGKPIPTFQVNVGRSERSAAIGYELATRLADIRFTGLTGLSDGVARVAVERSARWAPREGPRLLPPRLKPQGLTHVGLAISPLYRSKQHELYPAVLREFRRQLTRALQHAFYDFSCSRTRACPRDYHMLGKRAVVKAVWEVDEQLAGVSDSFDFLLQVSPTNAEDAWQAFRSAQHQSNPIFFYRALSQDTAVLQRSLFAAAVEKVNDPTLDELFRSKQSELALQIGLVGEIGTRHFVLGGMQLYGEVEDSLLDVARELVARCPVGRGQDDASGGSVGDEELAELARAEIEKYRSEWPEFAAKVTVRDDIARGLLVSQGSVLIGRGTHVPRRRVDALLQHEVGTHALTYHNARAQPLRLLSSGLDGYDALQEGLAVLAEYIAGGLSVARLRLLGARVVGVHAMLQGAEFVETFRLLNTELGFEPRTAFNVATRIHRGGGLAKDAIYLRGLIQALEYLASGGDLQPLAAGKIAPQHIPLVNELQLRGILRKAPLLPHYLQRAEAAPRIARLREGMTVLELVDDAPF